MAFARFSAILVDFRRFSGNRAGICANFGGFSGNCGAFARFSATLVDFGRFSGLSCYNFYDFLQLLWTLVDFRGILVEFARFSATFVDFGGFFCNLCAPCPSLASLSCVSVCGVCLGLLFRLLQKLVLLTHFSKNGSEALVAVVFSASDPLFEKWFRSTSCCGF